MALYPRRITSTATTIQVTTNDGTSWFDPTFTPAQYDGTGAFTVLSGIVSGLSSSGGFVQLEVGNVGSAMDVQSKFPSGAALTAAGHYGVLYGTEGPGAIYSVWGGGAWTGYGFFVGACGAHDAYWGNELYYVRVADTPKTQLMYNPAPVLCTSADGPATVNGTNYVGGQIIKAADRYSATWGMSGSSAICEWGPKASHTYAGMIWDPATKLLIWGGDAQVSYSNPTQELAQAQNLHDMFTFNVYAGTPKSAWTKYSYNSGNFGSFGSDGYGCYSFVRNPNGTVSFRTRGTVRTFNPAAPAIPTLGSPNNAPLAEVYTMWNTTATDSVTGKYYELRHSTSYYGEPNIPWSIYEVIGGSRVLRVVLPYTNPWIPVLDSDNDPGIVIRNGIAYLWNGTNAVLRVNLATQAITEFNDPLNPAIARDANNGIWGRWAYCSEAGCFVGLSAKTQGPWVFRPPASWGGV